MGGIPRGERRVRGSHRRRGTDGRHSAGAGLPPVPGRPHRTPRARRPPLHPLPPHALCRPRGAACPSPVGARGAARRTGQPRCLWIPHLSLGDQLPGLPGAGAHRGGTHVHRDAQQRPGGHAFRGGIGGLPRGRRVHRCRRGRTTGRGPGGPNGTVQEHRPRVRGIRPSVGDAQGPARQRGVPCVLLPVTPRGGRVPPVPRRGGAGG